MTKPEDEVQNSSGRSSDQPVSFYDPFDRLLKEEKDSVVSPWREAPVADVEEQFRQAAE